MDILIPTWVKIVFTIITALGVYLLVVEGAVRKASDGASSSIKSSIKNKSIQNRLSAMVEETRKDVNQKRDFYEKLGKEMPLKLQLEEMVVNTTTGAEGILNMMILFISLLASIGIVLLTYRMTGLFSVMSAICLMATAFIITSMLSITGANRRQKRAFQSLMTLHSQYQNNDNFVTAVALARDVFISGTPEYRILDDYYKRVKNLNMSRESALKLLVQDLDNNTHIKQYMEIVSKAEGIDSSYKLALDGIPTSLKSVIDDRAKLIENTVVTSIFVGASTLILLYYTVLSPILSPQTFKDAMDMGSGNYIGAGLLSYVLLTLILAYSNRAKTPEKWGDK